MTHDITMLIILRYVTSSMYESLQLLLLADATGTTIKQTDRLRRDVVCREARVIVFPPFALQRTLSLVFVLCMNTGKEKRKCWKEAESSP